jgi:hypothetical protein
MTNTWVQLRNNWLLIALAFVLLPANYYWWAFLTAESRQAAARPDERAVIGQQAPPVIARDLDGEWRRLDFSATSHAILYVTSPQCGWCTRNIPNVKALAQAAAGEYAFIGLFSGTGDAREYRERHGLTFPLYTAVDDASRDAYRMIGTPQTVVIRNGVVVANWIGAYGGQSGEGTGSDVRCLAPGDPAGFFAAGSDASWLCRRRWKFLLGRPPCHHAVRYANLWSRRDVAWRTVMPYRRYRAISAATADRRSCARRHRRRSTRALRRRCLVTG